MDDKFNQWCINTYGMTFNDLQVYFPTNVIDAWYVRDLEIEELKAKIAALENKR